MALAAACARLAEAPAVEAATIAEANVTLWPSLCMVLAIALASLGIAPSASRVATMSLPFKPMRSKDTSLPHSFQVAAEAVILLFHHSRWVVPSMPTAASGSAPALLAAARSE